MKPPQISCHPQRPAPDSLESLQRRLTLIESFLWPDLRWGDLTHSEFLTVPAFAERKGVKLPRYWSARLGQMAVKFCRDQGIEVRRNRYNYAISLNTYPVAVLNTLWEIAIKEGGLQ